MADKTSVDDKEPGPDDVLVALLGVAMLSAATELLVNMAAGRKDWSLLVMRAMIYLMDRGEERAGLDHPSVLKLRDLCNKHLAKGVQ
jgi:hypothetical protein